MNNTFKKIITWSAACLISLFALSYTPAHAGILSSIRSAAASLKWGNGGSEKTFNFIKSNESTYDFLYDGSLFLYGGIAFISISIIGIVLTLKPKKKKKKDINRMYKKTKK